MFAERSIMSFFQEKLEELQRIQNSVTEENCFSKLVEYFRVCHEISRREKFIINTNLGGLEQAISLFLLNLPYCELDDYDRNVSELCADDAFLGCRIEEQEYTQSFVENQNEYQPMIFTYRDNPTKESITVYYEGVNRTLAYIENEEKNIAIVKKLKELVCYHFFECQRETLRDYFMDRALFYMMIASEFRTSCTKS